MQKIMELRMFILKNYLLASGLKPRLIIVGLFVLSLVACGSYSSNYRIGNEMSETSLDDQRKASTTVVLLEEVPAGAVFLGEIDAGRCHQSIVEVTPNKSSLILDLKIAAYALGGDAIADVDISKKTAFSKDCWYMLDGEAKAYKLSR